MKWAFILYLPAAVSMAWALAVITFKRHPNRAQLLLSCLLIMEAFAMMVISVFFRGKAGSLFIYDFIFVSISVFCVPLYYVGICALTEPRGTTLAQRRTFIVPLLYVAGLTAGAFWLGPRQYEAMCHALRENTDGWIAGNAAWNFMYFWDHILFPAVMLVTCIVLMLMAVHKVRIFSERVDTFYSAAIRVPTKSYRRLQLYTLAFLLLAFATVYFIDFRPPFFKYYIIVATLMIAVLQFVIGQYIYRMDYDARYIATLMSSDKKNI